MATKISPGCTLLRYQERVTITAIRREDCGRVIFGYVGYAHGARYEGEDWASSFVHAKCCACHQQKGQS
jgi:hypothetical protein